MVGTRDEWLTLKERTDQARVDFIRTDLDACNTFVTVAETAYSMDPKVGTSWRGVSLDTMLANVKTDASYVVVRSYGGYSTNLPLKDILDKQAWIAFRFGGQDLAPEHGGPARLLVPHLYLWKSAKWVRGLNVTDQDEPGFWETYGYHDRGDPWLEQRYWGD